MVISSSVSYTLFFFCCFLLRIHFGAIANSTSDSVYDTKLKNQMQDRIWNDNEQKLKQTEEQTTFSPFGLNERYTINALTKSNYVLPTENKKNKKSTKKRSKS